MHTQIMLKYLHFIPNIIGHSEEGIRREIHCARLRIRRTRKAADPDNVRL